MEQILSVLYGVSGIAASAFYIPQILRYHRDQHARRSITLLSWAGWIAVTAVSITYAVCVLRDYLVATVAATSMVAQSVVLFYGATAQLGNRGHDFSDTVASESASKVM